MVQILPQRKNFYNSLIEGVGSAAQDIGAVYKGYQEKKKLSALGQQLAKEFGQPELAPLFAKAAATKPEELVKSLVSFGKQKRLSELTRQLSGDESTLRREEPTNISNDHDEYRPHSLGSLIGGDNFQAPPQRSLPGMGQDMNQGLNASSQKPNLPKLDTGGVMHEPQMFGKEGVSDKEDMGPFRENPKRRAIIDEINALDPQLGAHYDRLERERNRAKESQLNRELTERKESQRIFENERSYHSAGAKKAEDYAEGLRDTLPLSRAALKLSRNALEEGDLGFFSLDNLANRTGIDAFRSAKGAQLVAAGKENLISNISRVSARAQNQWAEQQFANAFPKIGQSLEANLTVQEMIEGDLALKNAYLRQFDKLSAEDEKQYGYVRKDIGKRAHEAAKQEENQIFDRTSYRVKEIQEREQGIDKLQKNVGKKVSEGTPFTLRNAKLYIKKYGDIDKALKVAKQNGYKIPHAEEYKLYKLRPEEFLERG